MKLPLHQGCVVVDLCHLKWPPEFYGNACGKPNAFVYPLTQAPLASLMSPSPPVRLRLTNEE